jgi:DNA polymerase III subunit gamma/tau
VTPVGPVTLQQLKDAWPEVLEAVKAAKLSAWLVVLTARVLELRDNDVLLMSFPSKADVDSFKQKQAPGQGISDYLRAAIVDVLGIHVKFLAREDSGPAVPAEQQPAVRITADKPQAGTPVPASQATPARPTGSAPTGSAPTGSAPTAGGSAAPAGAPSSAATSSTSGAAPSSEASSSSAGAAVTTGWATVAIPGSAPAAPVAPEAAVSASRTATTVAEPPFDEEPPPFDDDVPPEMDAPEAESESWATSDPAEPSASVPGSQSSTEFIPGSMTPHAEAPTAERPARKAPPAARSGARPPAFEEKQRYGESVVREILGATFLEEQPHASAPRSRGE